MFEFVASVLAVLGLTGTKLTVKTVAQALRNILMMDIEKRAQGVMALVSRFVPATITEGAKNAEGEYINTERERTPEETQSYMQHLVLKMSVYLFSYDLRMAGLAVAAEDSKTRIEKFRAGLKAAGLEPTGEITVGRLANLALPSGRLENYRKTVLNSLRKVWSLKSMGSVNSENVLYTAINALTSEERAALLTMLQSQYHDISVEKMRKALTAAYPAKKNKFTPEYFEAKTAKAVEANNKRREAIMASETPTQREKVMIDYPYIPMPNVVEILSNYASAYNQATARMVRDAKATAGKTRREVQNEIRAARPTLVSIENRDIRLMPSQMQNAAIEKINMAITLMSFGWGVSAGTVTIAEALQHAWADFFDASYQWFAGSNTLFLIAKMAKFRMMSGKKALAVDVAATGKSAAIYVPLQSEGEDGETLDVSDSIMPKMSPEHSKVETNQILEFLMQNGTVTPEMAGAFELQTEGETDRLTMPKLSSKARKAIETEYRTQKDGTTKRLPNAGNAFDGTPRQWAAILIAAYKEREAAFAAELDSLGVVGAERAEYAAMFATEKVGPAPFGPRVMSEKDGETQAKAGENALYYQMSKVKEAACSLTGVLSPKERKALNKARKELAAQTLTDAKATAERAAERVTNIMAALSAEPDNVNLIAALRVARLESEQANRTAERATAQHDPEAARLPYSFTKARHDGEVWRGPLASALGYENPQSIGFADMPLLYLNEARQGLDMK